ncbi:MAG: FtsX-like permease family protein [Thermoleophilia bacterium]|nr:FtsX-like permease family protein [Thermoleophilia bacterium]
MHELFGIPVGALALVLAGIVGAALAALAVVAVRNRVFVRLGVRNVRRRPGRSALIVTGLMLGTAIIAAALATGDTMSHTIRQTAVVSLGQTDEVISAAGADVQLMEGTVEAAGIRYFPEGHYREVADALSRSPLVGGVAPAVVETIAVQDASSRQNEPRVTLFGSEPRALARGFDEIRALGGDTVSLADLGPREVFLNAEGADELRARAGDSLRLLAGERMQPARVKAVVRFRGTGADGPAVLVSLPAAQELVGQPGQIKHVLVSNRGGEIDGAGASDEVIAALGPTLSRLGLEAKAAKADALETADLAGSQFMSFFTTFGSFSIAAGLLLIFLIFVMLAAERRAELGIARAVGTRRGHLVQTFLYEGVAYALLAAAVGALVGIAVAYVMVIVMAGAFAASTDLEIAYSVSPRSVVVAYAVGVLLTFLVVGLSAWRVSRMNIVTAIRNLPEPPARKRGRRRWLLGTAALVVGALLALSGARADDAVTFSLGVALVILSFVPLARAAGASERVARTAGGTILLVWFLLPMSDWILGDPKTNFSIFIVAGLMIVIGSTWILMHNADALIGAIGWVAYRVRALAPVFKMSMAYPLRDRFRTGVTLAMFTLVVFTLVVGATTSGAFMNAFDDVGLYGGGFDVRATSSPASPIRDIDAALARADNLGRDVSVAASESVLPVQARQEGADAEPQDYVARGLDDAFLRHTTYGLGAIGHGYRSERDVWRALAARPGLAVVDPTIVPRRSNFNFGVPPDFRLSGFYVEDESFRPVEVVVRDPQTSQEVSLEVIAVLADTVPLEMAGISTSQRTLERAFGERVPPTVHVFALRDGVDPAAAAGRIESAFLANGVEADAYAELVADAMSASITFNRLVQGFMGLGLVVGVAALGVIAARSVVERRQQIGVLRAIGFRRGMVQLSFLLESSFIAGTSILVGFVLGLVVSWNVIRDSQSEPSWDNLTFVVPWANLVVIFLVVYVVALATTLAPALRASRVYPAEALRYE